VSIQLKWRRFTDCLAGFRRSGRPEAQSNRLTPRQVMIASRSTRAQHGPRFSGSTWSRITAFAYLPAGRGGLAGGAKIDPNSNRVVAEYLPADTRIGSQSFSAPGKPHGEPAHPSLTLVLRPLKVRKRFPPRANKKAPSICRTFPARSAQRPGQIGCDRLSAGHNMPRGRFRR
jgi:hypothetical protein